MVLSSEGGALAAMLTPFRLGLGGVVGSGGQYISWITREDLVRAIEHFLATESVAGPVNTVAPSPVTNREFTKTLGRVLNRPTVLPAPAPLIRLGLGEMGENLLLAGQRVVPRRLPDSGFAYRHATLEDGLRACLC
jgi:uncharacterized protein (TIGR01777 family)